MERLGGRMKGIEHVAEQLDALRFRVSRLIELRRVPEGEGKLLWRHLVLDRDLARGMKEKEGRDGN